MMKLPSKSVLGTLGAGLVLALAGGMGWAQQSSTLAAAAVAEPEPAGGPAVMRRLTESHYRTTIADVFAPDVPIAGRFARALREDGLIAVGTSHGGVSAFMIEQYDASARGIAAEVTGEKRRAEFVPCQPKSETVFDKACAVAFVGKYGPRLFRRPIATAERDRFVEIARLAQERLGSFHRGLEHALAGMLVSPHFLLRVEHTVPNPRQPGTLQLDPWSKATRLSYFLTEAAPDAELLRAAGKGELDTAQGLTRQVDRLMSSPRVADAVRAFFWDMLHFDGFNDLFKDPEIYPAYTTAVAADAQEQTLRTIVDHLVAQRGDYRKLFTTRTTYMSRPLGVLYRVPVATRNGWEKVEYPKGAPRTGILTDISMLALHSHPGRSSPTLRGKSVREIFMCTKVPDPPGNVDFTAVQDAVHRPGSTARMRLNEHNESPACAGCHKLTDPIGFPLENFDGAGSFRATENGSELDLSGSLDGIEFSGPVEMGQALHNNPMVPACLVDKLYRSSVGRAIAPSEEPYLEYLTANFEAKGFRVLDLMRMIALSKTFYSVSVPETKAQPGTNTAASAQKGDRS